MGAAAKPKKKIMEVEALDGSVLCAQDVTITDEFSSCAAATVTCQSHGSHTGGGLNVPAEVDMSSCIVCDQPQSNLTSANHYSHLFLP